MVGEAAALVSGTPDVFPACGKAQPDGGVLERTAADQAGELTGARGALGCGRARYAHDRSVLNPTDQVVTARPKGPSGMRHHTLIATSVISVVVVLLLAACGGSSSSTSVAHLGAAASPAAGSGPVGPGSPDFTARLLKYAVCMREHGVPHFPDPNANRRIRDPHQSVLAGVGGGAGDVPQVPARWLPPSPGSATDPSAQALAQMLRVSQCMRRHGIHDFPDPGSRLPLHPPARGVITDMSGVILVFPSALAMQSPAFAQAEAECNLGIRPPS